MESGTGAKEEGQPSCLGLGSAPTELQHAGKQHSTYFHGFIWLGPSKDREARVNALKRCAIASTLGSFDTIPEVAEGILREAYSFEYPWKAVPIGPRTYLIEFPSMSILEEAAAKKVLFGSNNALAVRKWEENMGAHGTVQRFWVRIRGLPRECWGWDDVKGILDHYCGLERMECVEASSDSRGYMRAFVVSAGPEFFPISSTVIINSKLHNVHIHDETGQSGNFSDPRVAYNSISELRAAAPSGNKWSARVKRGYVVTSEIGEPMRAIQSMSSTGPYVPNSLEVHSKKIGPSGLSREGCSKAEITSALNQGPEGATRGGTALGSKRTPLELFPDDFWSSKTPVETNAEEGNMNSPNAPRTSSNKGCATDTKDDGMDT